jgi:sialic acid synthase SpsE
MKFAKKIALGERRIGSGYPCFVVAYIGINHNGDMDLARKEIDAAIEAGADSVKFQNYKTEDFIADRKLTYAYENNGKRIVESQYDMQYDMFKRCELNYEMLADLKAYCDKKGVALHSTPKGMDGLSDLCKLGVEDWKE